MTEPFPIDPAHARPAGAAVGDLHLQLLEMLAPPSLLVNAAHDILHLSPAAGRFLQLPGGEPTHNLQRTVHPALGPAVRAALEQAVQTGEPGQGVSGPMPLDGQPMQVRVRAYRMAHAGRTLFLVTLDACAPGEAPDGRGVELRQATMHYEERLQQLEASHQALQDAHAQLQQAARQAQDSTRAELADALAQAEQTRRELEAADAAKDRFLAVLSHELRNPLASIASASELLLVPKLPASALEKAAHVVQRQAKAMKVLLDELLDVSRLTLGRLTLSKRAVSIASVIQNALETTRPLVQAAGHELSLQLPQQQVEVDADPLRLAQVVSNLVSNAAKYTPEGGHIAVAVELYEDEVVISVQDNGIGMEPGQIDRMFDLFTQAESAINRSSGGLGIGLALSRNIVELHGGWIMASSAGPGQGTQMRIGLPVLRRFDLPPAPEPQPAAQALTPATAAEGELILVADDNGDAAWGMAKLLELSGYRAVMARGGEEALRLAEQHRPAIALLDIGMPDLSGHEVARRLRAQPWGRAMILIAATGWGQESDVRQSMEAGFDAHLTKPLNVGRIRSLLDELQRRPR